MKQYFGLISLLTIWLGVSAQTPKPGGVHGVFNWYITEQTSSSPRFTSVIDPNSYFPLNTPGATAFLNRYPALSFSGSHQLKIDLDTNDLSKASYFTVYQPINLSAENIIWHIRKSSRTDLVLTTSRTADLEFSRYINYNDKFPLYPKVNTYVQQKPRDSIVSSQMMVIGGKSESPLLPVNSFKGLIPEIIIFQRVLAWDEQIRVASYLAIKYGVTLSEPGGSYLSSNGTPLWQGEDYAEFHNNIAGIGRDDSSGLYQQIASSSNVPGLLAISSMDSLSNNNFLLYGDNNMPLAIGEKIPGIPLMLERKWLLISTGLTNALKTQISVDTRRFDVALPNKPVYWLAVDSSGTANFSSSSIDFIRMEKIAASGIATFDFVKNNNSEKTLIGLVVGNEVLSVVSITEPICGNPSRGSFDVKIWGGTAPFTITIYRDEKQFYSNVHHNKDNVIISNVTPGKYNFIVADNNGNIYKDQFYVNNSDGPTRPAIARRYILPEGQELKLDARQGMEPGIFFEWFGPSKFYLSGPQAVIKTAGEYTLKITQNNCSYVHNFIVAHPPKNIFKSVLIYPNPSSGFFTVKLTVDKTSPVRMDVYAEDGRYIHTREFNGFANYKFTEHIETNGIYFFVFSAGLSRHTEKIVIAK